MELVSNLEYICSGNVNNLSFLKNFYDNAVKWDIFAEHSKYTSGREQFLLQVGIILTLMLPFLVLLRSLSLIVHALMCWTKNSALVKVRLDENHIKIWPSELEHGKG